MQDRQPKKKKKKKRRTGEKRVYPKVERVEDERSGLFHAKEGNLGQLRQLIEQQGWSTLAVDKHGTNSLMWAAGYGHLCVCEYLVGERGMDVESRNKDGRTPLMWALRN
eukprot:g1175.t1